MDNKILNDAKRTPRQHQPSEPSVKALHKTQNAAPSEDTATAADTTKISALFDCSDTSELAQTLPFLQYETLLESVCRQYVDHFNAEVGLIFISAQDMASLNEEYMQKTGPTDVLAFPIQGRYDSQSTAVTSEEPWVIGDIAICAEVAQKSQLRLIDEVALLIVHGALHLFGYDHFDEESKHEMFERQNELLGQYWKEK